VAAELVALQEGLSSLSKYKKYIYQFEMIKDKINWNLERKKNNFTESRDTAE
jgi:hypothetical protein